MLKFHENPHNITYAINCLRAFKYVRGKYGEEPIFKHLDKIQKIVFDRSKIVDALFFDKSMRACFQTALSQKILRENSDSGLSAAVMLGLYGYKKPIVMPYPKEWRNYLSSLGLVEDKMSSKFFVKSIFIKIYYGLSEIRSLLRYSFACGNRWGSYTSFVGFPDNSLQSSHGREKLFNFLSFAERKFFSNKLIFVHANNLHINDRALFSRYPFSAVAGIKNTISFALRAIFTTIKCLISGLLGQWGYLYMLQDLIVADYLKTLPQNELPIQVVFSNSHYIYKPLWTVFAEKRGVKVSLLFYATNTYNIQYKGGESGLVYGYKQMTWKSYYTFHENHAEFIRNVTGKDISVYIEKSPIDFIDIDLPLDLPTGKKIAIFDVQPFRDLFLALIGRPTNLYYYDVSKIFFDDLILWCQKNETYLVIKPKRDVHERLCPHYARLLHNIGENKWCIIVNSSCSPKKICRVVDAVVCQPFTSAALYAIETEKPVIYYDPFKEFLSEQPAAQGVKTIAKRDELFEWLDKELLKLPFTLM